MNTTLGIDCSHWQDDHSTPQRMDFKKASAAGARFAFIKVSERGAIDADFEINWLSAKAAGLPRGAYHFLRWDLPAITQARVFCACLAEDAGELPPVADFEAPAAGGKYPSNAMLLQFLEEVEKRLNRRPMVYTSPGFWRSYGNNKMTGRADAYWSIFPLWIAHYFKTISPDTQPAIPAPWQAYSFWQFTSAGDGPAFGAESRSIDLNYFNGDAQALRDFMRGTRGQSADRPDDPAQPPPVEEAEPAGCIKNVAERLKHVEDFLSGFRLP